MLFQVGCLGLLGLKFLFDNFQFLRHVSVARLGLLGWLGCWFFELVVLFQLAVFLVGFFFWVGWLGRLGLKFLFENCQFLRHVFSWLVGLVGLLLFQLVVFLS